MLWYLYTTHVTFFLKNVVIYLYITYIYTQYESMVYIRFIYGLYLHILYSDRYIYIHTY